MSLDPGVYGVLGRVVGLVLPRPGMRREGSALLLKPEHQVSSEEFSSVASVSPGDDAGQDSQPLIGPGLADTCRVSESPELPN